MYDIPFVSIIIPTYHDWERLSICIEALAKQTYSPDLFEVIIVNNDPQDPTPGGYPLPRNFKIIEEAGAGSYAARNAGIAHSKGVIIGFTDSDCIPEPNWIEAAVRYFQNNPGMDRIGGNVELFIAGKKHTLAEAYEKIYSFRQERNVSEGGSVTANMFTRKQVLEQVGLFNASMYSGGDMEWGLRAAAANFKIGFAPDVVVKHPARKELKQLLNKIKRVAAGKLYVDPLKDGYLAKLLYFVYEFRPPVNEFKHINTRGKHFSWRQKLQIFFLRYHIRILRAYEQMKLYHGAKPFKDNVAL